MSIVHMTQPVLVANPDTGQVVGVINEWNQYQALPTSADSFPGGTLALPLNEATPVALPSSSIVNVGGAAANTIVITLSGTTTVTGFDNIAAGAERKIIFAGIMTLQFNATSFILLTGASILTAVNDTATFISLGGGNWQMTDYCRYSGQALTPSDIAALTHAATAKATPVDADEMPLWDSVTNGLKKLTWAAKKATLKTYFDTLYSPTGAGMVNPMTTAGDLIVGGAAGAPARLAIGATNYVLAVVSGASAWVQGALLSVANVFTNVQAVTPYRANISGAVSIDLANTAKSNNLHLTLTGNVTSFAFTNPVDGAVYNVRLIEDATGGRTFSGLPSAFKIIGTGTPAYPSAANAWGFFSAEYGSTEATYATSCPAVAV